MANLDIIRGRSTVLSLVNNSGATRSPGDLVVQDTTVSDAFTTSTSSNTTVPVWVVDETIGISSNGRVVVSGYARNVRTLATSARGDYLYHSTTSVTAATLAGTNPQAGAFGRVTTAGSGTASTAYIFPTVETATASLSYASNSNDVGNPGVPGVSTLVTRADHVHRGVASISHTSNTFYGPITLVAQGSIGITSSATGTFAINAVAGSGSGGSGITRTTQGKTAVGGSFDGNRGLYLKKLTLASAGLVASIVVHIKGDATNVGVCVPVIYSDTAGAPINILVGVMPTITTQPVRVVSMILNTTARWVTLPVGAWLDAGDYWFGCWLGPTDNIMNIAYDASGSDYKDHTDAQNEPVDSTLSTISDSTNNYSIYINVLR